MDLSLDEYEPQVTSLDPAERKLARKLRIDRRWDSGRRQTASLKTVDEDEPKTEVEIQVKLSVEILEKYIREGEEYITNIRVANDSREVDRRDREGIGREKVIEQLEKEAEAAQHMFDEIAEKWSVIANYKDPLHINEEIQSQKEKCDMLIKQKDGLIAMLRDEIKKSEKIFTKDQKKQMEDINILAQRVIKQITFMRSAFQLEFDDIEEVILKERKKLIDMTNKKWEELYKKRDHQEIVNSDKKYEQLQEFSEKMIALRVNFEEKFRHTYIKLAKDTDSLQRELERIKALALLNSEKLDYNYQILKKREDENIIIKSQQKRRINKLQDVINTLRNKIHDYESSTNNLIKKISEDTKKLHKNILLVEDKADHFAKVNNEKFNQIWELNTDACLEVLDKITETDKILHEQQMGTQWTPPAHNVLKMKHLQSYREAVAATGEVTMSQSIVSCSSTILSKKMEEIQSARLSYDSTGSEFDANPTYRRLQKYILTHISDKSGFLTEKRLGELLKPFEDDQKTLVRLDNVFSSLGINDREDIKALIIYFVPYAYCPVCLKQPDAAAQASTVVKYSSQMSIGKKEPDTIDSTELDQAYGAIQQPAQTIEEIVNMLVPTDQDSDENEQKSEDSMELACGGAPEDQSATAVKEKKTAKRTFVAEDQFSCEYNHQLLISSVFILKALRQFVMSYYEEKEGLPTTSERLHKKRLTVSRLLSKVDIEKYWARFKMVYDEDRIRVWDALFEGLKKYHEILKDRKMLCEEVVDLRRQNRDLKKLLANYIDHGDIMPPYCAIERNTVLRSTPPTYTKSKMM